MTKIKIHQISIDPYILNYMLEKLVMLQAEMWLGNADFKKLICFIRQKPVAKSIVKVVNRIKSPERAGAKKNSFF